MELESFADSKRCWHVGCQAAATYGLERACGPELKVFGYCRDHLQETLRLETSAGVATRVFHLKERPPIPLPGRVTAERDGMAPER